MDDQMSNISDAFDKIVAVMEDLFPDHHRLWNPYQPELNTDDALRAGWGVGFGPGERTNRNVSCQYSWRRDIIIVQTRQYLGTTLSTAKNASKQKELMEDQNIILDEFEENVQLRQSTASPTDPRIVKFDPKSDSGIIPIYPDRQDFFMIETIFDMEYFRAL